MQSASSAEDIREVRCSDNRWHFNIIDGNKIEVRCKQQNCTEGKYVVLHRFALNGELLETLKFTDPIYLRGHRSPRIRKERP
jgi:nitrite reductase/ring-hydroxylating ferredoxin subunit